MSEYLEVYGLPIYGVVSSVTVFIFLLYEGSTRNTTVKEKLIAILSVTFTIFFINLLLKLLDKYF